ncbi:MAG: enoyl-CoA hydratase/isomerase family protein [Thermodesulfobacteriota bacterium]
MKYSTVLYEEKDGIGIITLNRPEQMNAVVEEMYEELSELIDYAAAKPGLSVILVKGSPLIKEGRVKYSFCAGADLKKHKNSKRSPDEKRAYIEKAHLVNKKIYECQKPVIACMNGHARGAGAELALCCDFIIAADEATIAFPETGLGTFVGGGVTYLLPRIVGQSEAKNLIYTGEVLSGKQAVEKKLALKSYPMESVIKKSLDFAGTIAEKAPVSINYAKKMINKSWSVSYDAALSAEAEAIISCMSTKDWQEGIDAFSEKRQPFYKGE